MRNHYPLKQHPKYKDSQYCIYWQEALGCLQLMMKTECMTYYRKATAFEWLQYLFLEKLLFWRRYAPSLVKF